MDGLSFEQWVLFVAVTFRQRYRTVAQRAFPELEPSLPLARSGKLTVVQVNSGEAVHFIFTSSAAAESTACRHLTVEPPEGMTLRDWAVLHEEGYRRFVERAVPGQPVGHFVVFPSDGDAHGASLEAAERIVREHAARARA